MTLSPRVFSVALAFVAATSSSHPAFAQTTPPGPPPPAAPAPDDEYLAKLCRANWHAMGLCRDRPWTGPQFTFGADLGVSAMTETGPFGLNKGVGSVTEAGPAWGVRAGIDFLPWLGLEARYVGMYNPAQASASPAGSVGFLTSGGEAVLRLTAPLPFVRPYVFGGIGYYDVALSGSSTAQAGSVLHSSSQSGIPMGFGLDVPLTWYLSVDLEAAYHFQLGESFSAVTTNDIDGGDLSTVHAVLRLRL